MLMTNKYVGWLLLKTMGPHRAFSLPFIRLNFEAVNLRETIYTRCSGYCERCGLPLQLDFALHHRKLKSRGGKNTIQNLVALHHHCHNLGTGSVHLDPDEATRRGLMVPSWDDPALVPITLEDGTKVLLTEDGYYNNIDEDGEPDGGRTTNNSHW